MFDAIKGRMEQIKQSPIGRIGRAAGSAMSGDFLGAAAAASGGNSPLAGVNGAVKMGADMAKDAQSGESPFDRLLGQAQKAAEASPVGQIDQGIGAIMRRLRGGQ
jgi:hypothetical protein